MTSKKMCDCNQGRFPCSCKPAAHDNSEARQTFFGCVYRNAQSSPAEIGRLFARKVNDQKELTTEVVKLMESAFTVAMAESQDLRIQLDELKRRLTDADGMLEALSAEKYALEDQVKGLQELMTKGDAAAATLERMGYTYHGGQLWKPPLGKAPNFDLTDANRSSTGSHHLGAENVMCRGAWELGTACGKCSRCEETDPSDGWIMTLATSSKIRHHSTYWFGRLDRLDEMRPTKIEALNAQLAWRELRKQLAIVAVADGKARDV